MEISSPAQNIEQKIQDLREEAFTIVLPVLGIVTYLWFLKNIWMLGLEYIAEPMPPVSWFGSLILLSSFILSILVRKNNYNLATYYLVWAMLGATVCAVFTFDSPSAYNLFIIPIIFSGMFLNIPYFRAISIISTLLLILSGYIQAGTIFSVSLIGFPVLINIIIIFSTWCAVRNFHIALEWTWQGYQRAHMNENIIRDRQAQLKSTLKSLDNAYYVIEKNKYDLMVARDQALEATRLKQQFAQNISHELRTPLNLITAFSEMMVQTPEHYGEDLPPAYQRDMMIIYRNAKHLDSLVNDVLDLARIDSLEMKLNFEVVEINSFINEAAETIRGLVEHNGLSLNVTIAPDLPPVQLDPIRVRQVILNILNNAIRFTEKGGIFVDVSRENGHILISIRDTGVGIPENQIDSVFKQFYQVDGSTSRAHQGTGLGLAISRAFIELHGGKIWVESEVGKGSTFIIKIPVDHNELPIITDSHDTQWLYHTQLDAVVMVITDSQKVISLLTHYLRNCRILPTSNPTHAKAMAQKVKPIAVVYDQEFMPIDESQLKEISQEWGLENCNFISCRLPAVSERKIIQSDAFLLKPVLRQTLLDTISQWESQTDTILVVDDDDDYIHLISSMLETSVQKFQIITAYNGNEALSLLERRRPDLVLLDLNLPDIPGDLLIREIRADGRWANLPIIVLTGEDFNSGVELMDGMIRVMNTKGLNNIEIVDLIQYFVDSHIDKSKIVEQESG